MLVRFQKVYSRMDDKTVIIETSKIVKAESTGPDSVWVFLEGIDQPESLSISLDDFWKEVTSIGAIY